MSGIVYVLCALVLGVAKKKFLLRLSSRFLIFCFWGFVVTFFLLFSQQLSANTAKLPAHHHHAAAAAAAAAAAVGPCTTRLYACVRFLAPAC